MSGHGWDWTQIYNSSTSLLCSLFPSVCVCVCRYVDVLEQAVVTGEPVLIENLEETIDPIIDPLLGRYTIKKGR